MPPPALCTAQSSRQLQLAFRIAGGWPGCCKSETAIPLQLLIRFCLPFGYHGVLTLVTKSLVIAPCALPEQRIPSVGAVADPTTQ